MSSVKASGIEQASWLSALRFKLGLVYILPFLLLVVVSLLYASRQRIEGLQQQQMTIADSVVKSLTQDLRRIELFDSQAMRADMSRLLASFPDIEYLVVYAGDGRRLFYYNSSGLPVLRQPPPTFEGALIRGDHLHLLRPLPALDGGPPARVYLRQDYSKIRLQGQADRRQILLLGSVLTVFSLLSTHLAHRVLVKPIEKLAELARRVAQSQDYSLRSGLHRSDEVGALARGLDHLLSKVTRDLEQRDRSAHERELLIAELERRNEELDQFSYSVSHDLRNPLVTIRGFIGALRMDLAKGDAERVASDLERIDLAAQRMGNLLEDVLSLSRAGRVVQQPETVALGPLIEQVLADLAVACRRTKARIVVGEDLPSVCADPVRLREVFQNLLENALKFCRGEPRIEIDAVVQGNSVLCRVSDHGVGIDRRYQDRIFDLFERLTPEIEGTGVGLTLAQRIVEAHGGRLWVESEGQGHGATFYVELPRSMGSEAATEI